MLHSTSTEQFNQQNPQFTAVGEPTGGNRSALLMQMRVDAPVTFRPALHVDAMWQAMTVQPTKPLTF